MGTLAENYHRLSPGYSPNIIDACIEHAGFKPGSRLLEIASRTGIATKLFVQRGLAVTAVEPDPDMMAIARDELSSHEGRIRFVNNSFEGAIASDELQADADYDGVYVSNAWRWLQPPGQTAERVHSLLRPSGSLALLNNAQIISNPASDAFLGDLMDTLSHYDPSLEGVTLSTRASVDPMSLDEALFEPVFFGAEPQTTTLTYDLYKDMARSPTGHGGLPSRADDAFLGRAQELFMEYGGSIIIPTVDTVQIARRVE